MTASCRSLANGRTILWLTIVACSTQLPTARGDIVLFAASVDASTAGGSSLSVPAANNPHLPPIDPSVTLTPPTAMLDGLATGPLNGIVYGPLAFGGNVGGSTGFVHVQYVTPHAGLYQLVWEVANALDPNEISAFAVDNVRINGSLLFGFDAGLPGDFLQEGVASTSAAVANLAPTQGSAFAFLDTTGNARARYDTVDGTTGSRLTSSRFLLGAGDTLSLDLAFLSNDGDVYHDYGIAVLQAVPEPTSLVMALTSLPLAATAWRLGRRRAPSKAPKEPRTK